MTGKSSFTSKLIDQGVKAILFLCVALTVVTTVIVIFIMGDESYNFFQKVSLTEFLFGREWTPLFEPKSFGVLPLVCGTFLIVVGSAIIALPAGLLVAIFLSEYASERLRNLMKPVLELLAGIPTVVYGYFALTFVTPLLRVIFPDISVFNALSAAIVVGIMILPMICSLCDDAFRAVPQAIKEGGYAVGATSFEVVTQIVIPAAKSRIGAATILAISRAIGETMAVTLAAGATPIMTLNPLESIQTMTSYIVQVSMGDVPATGIEYQSSFAVATLLFVMTLVMNLVGHRLVVETKGSRR